MDEIVEQQRREAQWWKEYPSMKSLEDITGAVTSGFAIVVPDRGVGYRISEHTQPEFRVLEKNTYNLLLKISAEWMKRWMERFTRNEEMFLVVSSLARTEALQQELIEEGYPGVSESVHTKLGAFDIGTKWFEDHDPELLNILTEILERYHQEGILNLIKEEFNGVYHVASRPV